MPASKNKSKKTKKPSGLFRRLNPNTPAKRALIFILVFGVIGGGYLAYKSFASTTWTMYPKNMTTFAFAEKSRDDHSNKQPIDIVKLHPASDPTLAQGGRVTMPLYLNPAEFSRPRLARICATVRTQVVGSLINSWTLLHIRWRTSPANIGNVEDYAHNSSGDTRIWESNSYSNKCTQWYTPHMPDSTEVELQRHWDVTPGWSNEIYVAYVYLEWQ